MCVSSPRLKDLEFYKPQLQQYQRSSAALGEWIQSTQSRQRTLQSTQILDLQALGQHINQQKVPIYHVILIVNM